MAVGTPEEISMVQGSHTARFLAPRLSRGTLYLEVSGAEASEAVFEENEVFDTDYGEFEEDISEESEDSEDSEGSENESKEFKHRVAKVFEEQII